MTLKERADRIIRLPEVTKEDKAAVQALWNAVVAGLETYQVKQSKSRLQNWQAAEEALEKRLVDLERRYLKQAGDDDPEEKLSPKDLLARVNAALSDDISLLLATRDRAKEKLLQNPTDTSALAAFEKASRLLKERMADPRADEPAFKNRAAVLKYLKDQGYKIGRQKLYNDAKAGLLRLRPDGSVPESAVQAYINDPRSRLVRPEAVAHPDQADILSDLAVQLKEAELARVRAVTEHQELKNEIAKGKYILASDVETEMSVKAGALEAGIKHLLNTRFRECIQVVGGDPARTRAGIEFLMAGMDELLNDFARLDVIDVIVEKQEVEEIETE